MQIIALIPAHNEAAGIQDAVWSLQGQTRAPDQIIVICDNCTDDTERLAAEAGATTWVTVDNVHKKAGALNQVLDALLPTLDDEDVIFVQDADSFCDPKFIEAGMAVYTDEIGGVGGVFRGRIDAPTRWGRWIQAFQTNEYARYELDIRRQRGRVLVLTGTATLLRVRVLREVIAFRESGLLPGEPKVYDTKVLTEDNELSFAIMRLGYKIKSPKGCTLTTETMPTLRALGQQRLRWKRGALENLFDYGWDKNTRSYWTRQVLGAFGVLITTAYIASIAYGLMAGIHFRAFWIGVTVLFALERIVTVRTRGWKAMAVASLVVVENLYDFFLQGVQATAYLQVLLKKERSW